MSLYNRAVAYSLTDKSDLAAADYTAYLNLKSDDATAYTGRAVAYSKLAKWDLAAKDFGAVLAKDPSNKDALKNRAVAYYNGQNFKAAEADLNAYDAKYPGDADIAKMKGSLPGSDPTVAIRLLEPVFLKSPTDATVGFNLAVAYGNAKQYSKAAETYTKVLAIKPNDPDALRNRAASYYAIGQAGGANAAAAFDKAAMDATTLIGMNGPTASDSLLLRADVNFAAKKFAPAGADYEKYLATKSGDKYATGQAVASYINAKDYPGVIRAASTAISASPSDATNYNYRALAYLQSKDFTNAISDLTKYTGIKGDDPSAYFNLGAAYAGKGDNLNAAQSFEKAVSLKPDYFEAALQAAQLYKKQADADVADTTKANAEYDKAIALYDKAAAIKGTGKQAADAIYNKAVALEAKAKANDNDVASFKLAIEAWNRYITLAPTDPQLPQIKTHVEQLKAQVARDGGE